MKISRFVDRMFELEPACAACRSRRGIYYGQRDLFVCLDCATATTAQWRWVWWPGVERVLHALRGRLRRIRRALWLEWD